MTTAWEYKTINIATRNPDGMERLNQAGADGWEVVAVEMGIALLKRQVER